jgi:predicted Fe-Mo cluster-binding NifX family protein
MSKIAIPLANSEFTPHFGAAEQFALFDVDIKTCSITGHQVGVPPTHERGVFPAWLREQGVTTVLAGSMGPRAIQLFDRCGIEVVLGIEYGSPDGLVQDYLSGLLQSSGSPCEGGGFHDCNHHDREPRRIEEGGES